MHELSLKSSVVYTVLVFIAAAVFGGWLVFSEASKVVEEEKAVALQLAGAESSVLSIHLNTSISLAYTLEILLRERNFSVDQEILDQFAAFLLKSHPSVSNIQYAPGGVVAFISPLAGNEPAVGHNLLQDKQRNKEAFAAIEKRSLTVAGPFELVQGGFALAARLPVFFQHDEKFWGFTAVLVKIDDLMRATTIHSLTDKGYDWNISRIHPDTNRPHVFFGSTEQLLDDAVQLTMNAPNATWFINLRPKNGWLSGYTGLIVLGGATTALLSFALAYLTFSGLRKPHQLRIEVDRRTRELRAAQGRLAESETRLSQIADNSQMWIWEVDADGLYTYCSDTCEQIFGIAATEIVGKKYFYDLFHPDDRAELTELAFEVFKQKAAFKEFANRNVNRAGEPVWLSTSGVPVLGPNGELRGYRGADIDITRRNRLIEEQKRSAQWVAVGRLAANIAHEINNPTQAIVSFAELIKERPDDRGFIVELSERITREGMKIGALIRTTLHYSRPKGQGKSLESIEALVRSALALVEGKMAKEGVTVRVGLAEDLPKLFVNSQEIEQCLINLLNNAVDALSERRDDGGPRLVEIGAESEPEERTLRLAVRDNGPGISPEDIERVKDVFFTTKGADRGTGLGLAIVDDIMRNHGGRLEIESEQGSYAKVSLVFPLCMEDSDQCDRTC